tara:strand:+ start:1196 stop:1561 length:366 start_codon:yes stop_codon:yes gene_type:complete
MAEGWFRFFLPNVEVFSAGTKPEQVNKFAIEVMRSVGIDISEYKSNSIEEYQNFDFDFVITVCDNAKEKCPVFVSDSVIVHHSFIDPAKAKGTNQEILVVYEKVRDQLKEYIASFINKYKI